MPRRLKPTPTRPEIARALRDLIFRSSASPAATPPLDLPALRRELDALAHRIDPAEMPREAPCPR